MEQTRSLCARISQDLFERVAKAREMSGKTNNEYITDLLLEYFRMKENGGVNMENTGKTRTLAFQIPEDLFARIKAHLERETKRLGYKFTRREFVLGLIEAAPDEAEQESATESEPENGGPDSVSEEAGGDDTDGVSNDEPDDTDDNDDEPESDDDEPESDDEAPENEDESAGTADTDDGTESV